MGAAGSLGVGGGGAGGTGIWNPGGSAAGVAAGFQNAQARANNANEARYGQINAGYDSIEAEQRAITDKMYASAEEDLDEEYGNLAKNMAAQFTKNGFGPNQSTAVNSILQDNARRKLRAKGALFDQMAQTRMMPLNTRKDKLGFMERRNDNGPDMNQLTNLMTQAGEAQGGGGGLGQGVGQLGGNAVAMVPGGGRYMPPGRRVNPGNAQNLGLGQLRNLQQSDPNAYNQYRQTGQLPKPGGPAVGIASGIGAAVGGMVSGLHNVFRNWG
jgi:hypothetical protein